MDARLRAFAKQFQLEEEMTSALSELLEALIQDALDADEDTPPKAPREPSLDNDEAPQQATTATTQKTTAEAEQPSREPVSVFAPAPESQEDLASKDLEALYPEELETIDVLEYVDPDDLTTEPGSTAAKAPAPPAKDKSPKKASATETGPEFPPPVPVAEDTPTPSPEAEGLLPQSALKTEEFEEPTAEGEPSEEAALTSLAATQAELAETSDIAALIAAQELSPSQEALAQAKAVEATTMSLRGSEEALPQMASSAESLEAIESIDMPPLLPEERYELQNTLGIGGMGRVYQVRDWRLKRTLAMKILHPNWLRHPEWVRRFIEEAQATAQLQHPGIVPVHDLGQFTDGRFYFTMKQIVGRTLSDVIQEVHEASAAGQWTTTESGWSFRRLLDAYHRVCEAVAYAHTKGILHRDLKPENVMLGEHGEVKVVDWGLVKMSPYHSSQQLQAADPTALPHDDNPLHSSVNQTQHGEIKGTPAYMAPEQAGGEVDQISPATDVYGLGAILYEILSGHPPYTGKDVRTVLFRILSESPKPPGRLEPGRTYTGMHWVFPEEAPKALEGPMLPWSLVCICNKAMARLPDERYPDAGALAHEIEQWLEGAQKRARATELLEQAQTLLPSASALRQQAANQRRSASNKLSKIHSWESEDKKREHWTALDEATRLEWEAWMIEVEAEQKLQAALSHARDLEEAHLALVRHYSKIHKEAEEQRRAYTQMRAARYLQDHAESLPKKHPFHTKALAYLSGEGAVSLVTDPPGAQVLLYRYVTEHRRMKPVFVRFLGETPLHQVRLGMGSYLLVLRKEGYEEARYPVFIERMQHWDGIPPEGVEAMPVRLLPHGTLAANECYIPPGWCLLGSDNEAINSMSRRRLWVDGFVMQRYANTNTQVIAFLDELVAQGKETEALRYAPRERAGTTDKQGALIYGRTPEGGFVLQPDTEGDIWYPNYPALMMDWYGAQAFARWFSERTKRPWRLPAELEWEKAARGVDGRIYPWGDHFDPSWCCMRESRASRPLPSVVGTHEEDQSPYGVREMAGNVRDWCLDIFRPQGPPVHRDRVQIPVVAQRPDDTLEEDAAHILRVRRGGGWESNDKLCRTASRDGDNPTYRDYMSGFRLVRSLW